MPTNDGLTSESILEVLSKVMDPALERDLVQLGAIRGIDIKGGAVSFDLVLSTPAHPKRAEIEAEARKAVAGIAGVEKVEIALGAEVPGDGRTRGLAERPIKNAIAIASGKGGVGKTTVSVNVAAALAKAGASVGLLDADVYGPNVPTMLGVEHMPDPSGNKMTPAEAYGVKLISIAFLVEPGQPLIWRGPMLHSAIRQFISDVAWGDLDYLIVDLPPGTGDAPLSLTQSLPLSGAVIVTLPQKVSLEDARRGLEMFRTMDVPLLGVVENMSYLELPDGSHFDVFGQGGGRLLAEQTGTRYIGAIPMDPSVRQAGDNGVPVVISHPDSAVAKALTAVAEDASVETARLALQGGNVIPLEMVD
ncbi:MAG: Mrp/NBP35 family ATP-binding protein [Anaerolineales bacterium]|jgi:ATP-binding protein involved in chromosome partitioning